MTSTTKLALLLLGAHGVTACTTSHDCSLNGVCTVSTGVCACDVAWKGPTCGQLDLLAPAKLTPAYKPAQGTSWGGSVVAHGTSYHMFVAEMANGCGMKTWATNSIIRHAVSSAPAGPYIAQDTVMPPFSHNPTAVRAPDGTVLIYHIGCGTLNKGITPCLDCTNGASGKSCKGTGEAVACNTTTTNILYLNASTQSSDPTLKGPWNQLNAPFTPSPTMGSPYQVDNPTVTFFQNGSLLMLGRGGDLHHEAQSDGVITARSWRGPYIMHTKVGDAQSPEVEDPFVWQDKRGNFHALFHKFTDEHPNCGGHAFSTDGFTWTMTNEEAYTTTVQTADGVNHTFTRRERPHLLFAGTQPIMLFTSLTNWGKAGADDSAFTFAHELRALPQTSSR